MVRGIRYQGPGWDSLIWDNSTLLTYYSLHETPRPRAQLYRLRNIIDIQNNEDSTSIVAYSYND